MMGLLPGIGGVVLGVGTFDSGREMGAGLAVVRGGGLCALFMGGGPETTGAGAEVGAGAGVGAETGAGEDLREIGGGGGADGCEE